MASRLRMVLPLALVAWMPPAAMVRAGDADIRAVALRYLDEMRSAAHAPDREKLRKRMVAELSGTGFEGVQVLAALLREEKADPAPCQLAYA